MIWLGFVICIFGRLGFHVLKPGFGPPGLGFETFADKPRTPAPKKSDQPLSPNPDRFRAYTSNPDCPTNLNLPKKGHGPTKPENQRNDNIFKKKLNRNSTSFFFWDFRVPPAMQPQPETMQPQSLEPQPQKGPTNNYLRTLVAFKPIRRTLIVPLTLIFEPWSRPSLIFEP